MTGSTPYFILLCDLIISALNQNVVKIETALSASFVERQSLCWLHQLIYKKEKSFYKNILNHSHFAIGNACSGGTIGNITALLAARNHLFPEARKIGLLAAYQKANCSKSVILTSKRAHYSLKKAADLLGIGEENILSIPCENYSNKINLKELEKTILLLKTQKIPILAIVAIAGTTETGNIDDLDAIANLAKKFNIWLHVDAAWGGALLLSKKYHKKFSGIEHANSVVVDGHKFLYLTLAHSAVLFKDEKSLTTLKQSAQYILRSTSLDLGKTTLEGSRRFDSLKLWFAFYIFGRKNYEILLNHAVKNTFLFAKLIEQHPCFECTSAPETSIVTYRYVSQKLKKQLKNAQKISLLKEEEFSLCVQKTFFKDVKKFNAVIKNINLFLNEININLQKEQRVNGKSFVSRTILDSVWVSQEIVVLRALPFHPLTNKEILTEIIEEQEKLGSVYFEQSFQKFIREEPLATYFLSNV
jgi:glutamate decarboxylase